MFCWVEEVAYSLFSRLDRIAMWVRNERLAAAKAFTDGKDAARDAAANAKVEDHIIAEARRRGEKLASVDAGIKGYSSLLDLMKRAFKSTVR